MSDTGEVRPTIEELRLMVAEFVTAEGPDILNLGTPTREALLAILGCLTKLKEERDALKKLLFAGGANARN